MFKTAISFGSVCWGLVHLHSYCQIWFNGHAINIRSSGMEHGMREAAKYTRARILTSTMPLPSIACGFWIASYKQRSYIQYCRYRIYDSCWDQQKINHKYIRCYCPISSVMHICRKISGLDCLTHALACPRFTQPSLHIFLHFCTALYWIGN